eukprot:jgi/Ulvmu1/5267/UM022_0061.1
MGCFGNLCVKGASVQPKKRYNLLVPAVFVTSAPPWTNPLDPGTVRSIGSLQEYVEENVQRSPKVSRRLWRRVCKDHAKVKELGNVKIAVHGYIALLEHAKEGDCALFAKEIATNGDAVIPTLLAYKGDSADDQARCVLGLELLAHFLKAQNSSDYAQLLAQYIDVAHQLLNPDARFVERNGAALRVLRDYVAFTREQTIPCQHLDVIEQQALEWVNMRKEQPGDRALDVQFIHSLGLGDKYTTSDTCALSEQVIHELLLMSTDLTVGEQVISNGLRHLSTTRAWQSTSKHERTLQILRSGCVEADTHILLVSGLYRLLSDSALHQDDVPAVLRAAEQDAPAVPDALAAPALARAVAATAPLLPASDAPLSADAGSVEAHVGECMRSLAWQRPDPALILESLAGALQTASTAAPEPASRSVRAAHLAVRALSAEGGHPVEHVPTVLIAELARLSTLPTPPPEDPAAHLVLQTVAARTAAEAVALSPAPLKPGPLTLLQDALASQLDSKLPHSPLQLAAASGLFAAATARTPLALLPRSSALVLSTARSATTAPRGAQSAVEVLRTCDYCLQQLCAQAGVRVAQPAPLPAAACTTLAVDPVKDSLVATGVTAEPGASERAMLALQQSDAVESYTESVAKALSASPKLSAATGTNGSLDTYLEFTITKDDESVMSDDRTGSVAAFPAANGASPLPGAVPLADVLAPDAPTFLALPPPNGAAADSSPDEEFLPAMSAGDPDQEAVTASLPPPDAPVPAPAGPPIKLTDVDSCAAAPPVDAPTAADSTPFKLSDEADSRVPPISPPPAAAAAAAPALPTESMRSSGNTKRLPMPVMSMSRIPRSPGGPASSTEAALEGPSSVPYPDAPVDGNLYVPSDGGSPLPADSTVGPAVMSASPTLDRVKPRPVHAQPPAATKPPLGPSPIPVMSEGASWSPPPSGAPRSVHAVSRQIDVGPPSPTSSIGNYSTYSRTGYSRSIHAMPKVGGLGGEDSMMGVPPSPGYSVSASVTSSVRRRMRTSLHVLPKRGATYADMGPFGQAPRGRFRDDPHETAPL